MKVYFSNDWKTYDGIFTLTIVGFNWGFRTVGITFLNFAVEFEF